MVAPVGQRSEAVRGCGVSWQCLLRIAGNLASFKRFRLTSSTLMVISTLRSRRAWDR